MEGINWWIVVEAVLISAFVCATTRESVRLIRERRERDRIVAEETVDLDAEIAELLT